MTGVPLATARPAAGTCPKKYVRCHPGQLKRRTEVMLRHSKTKPYPFLSMSVIGTKSPCGAVAIDGG